MTVFREGIHKVVDKLVSTGSNVISHAVNGAVDEEEENEDVFDKELKLYTREGQFYVLIIDSNYIDLEEEKNLAEQTGCNVTVAESGAKGLELVSKDKYDLIFIALDLTRMDGLQTLHNMQNSPISKCRDSKIYVMLPETTTESDTYYLDQGFTGTIRKPIEKTVLDSYILANAPAKMLPSDERTINYIKDLALTTRTFKRYGIRFSLGFANFNNDLELYTEAVLKYCSTFKENHDRILNALYAEDELEYMEAVREMREASRELGAMYLADCFDDHVNMAKDDSLEVAQWNWDTVEAVWLRTVKGLSRWLQKPELAPEQVEEAGLENSIMNGIRLSDFEVAERGADVIRVLSKYLKNEPITEILTGDSAKTGLEVAQDNLDKLLGYDMEHLQRRKLNRVKAVMENDTELAIRILKAL